MNEDERAAASINRLRLLHLLADQVAKPRLLWDDAARTILSPRFDLASQRW